MTQLLLLKVLEAAIRLNLARTATYELIRLGKLGSIRIPVGKGTAIRVPVVELDRFVERQMKENVK